MLFTSINDILHQNRPISLPYICVVWQAYCQIDDLRSCNGDIRLLSMEEIGGYERFSPHDCLRRTTHKPNVIRVRRKGFGQFFTDGACRTENRLHESKCFVNSV